MDDTFCSSCPGCRHASVHALTPGTYSIDHNMSWATYFRCCHCGQTWFVCNYVGCTIPSYKNYYVTRQQLKRHARHWHARSNNTGTSSNMLRNVNVNEASVGDRDEVMEYDIPVDQQDVDDPIEPSDHSLFCFSNKGTAQFADWCITGTVIQATNCLVQQCLFQAPVSLFMDASSQLPSHAIQLFLHIAQMLVTTGQKNHTVLSHILTLLLGLLPSQQDNWPTMPSTMAGFQSHILNPTNKHSLVSLLPIPNVYMLSDDAHAYCCLQEIVAFVLLLPRTVGAAPVPLRLQQLCQSAAMVQFLNEPNSSPSTCLVSLGVLFWLDGWDPSASSKNNRSPVHTASATIICVDNTTGQPFDVRTFPISCGPGKANHNAVFQALQTSLNTLADGTHKFWSNYHGNWTTVRCKVLALLMDQPERRGSTCLLGGNSKLHAMFGMSCNFQQLELSFAACPKCVRVADRYLDAGQFDESMHFACRQCYGFSFTRLVKLGKYVMPIHESLSVDAPGYTLTDKPGTLSFEVLMDAWQYALRKLVYDNTWSIKEV